MCLQRLGALTPRLSRTLHRANEMVSRVEACLNDAGMMPARRYTAESLRQMEDCWPQLVYDHIGGGMRIGAQTFSWSQDLVSDDSGLPRRYPVESRVLPWVECPVHVQLQTIEQLPELLDCILNDLTVVLRLGDESLHDVEEMLGESDTGGARDACACEARRALAPPMHPLLRVDLIEFGDGVRRRNGSC